MSRSCKLSLVAVSWPCRKLLNSELPMTGSLVPVMSGVRTSRAVLCVCASVSSRRPLDTESSVPGRLLPLMYSQSVANGWESRSSVSRSKTSSSLIFSGQCRGFVLVSQTSFLRSFQLRLSHASRACFSDQSIKPSYVRYFRKYWRFFCAGLLSAKVVSRQLFENRDKILAEVFWDRV